VKRIKEYLRTPQGAGLVAMWLAIMAFCIATSVFHVPGRWLPTGLPWWLNFAIGCASGALFGRLSYRFGSEVERWARLRDEYAAAQRDIERLERGER